MTFGDRIPRRKEKREQVTEPLHTDDVTAEGNLTAEEYAAQLAEFAAAHPMTGPSPDQYTLLEEDGDG